jgi:hypothetical protein
LLGTQLSAQDQALAVAAAREAQLVPAYYVAQLAHYVAQLVPFSQFDPRAQQSAAAQVEVRASRSDLEFVDRLDTPPFLGGFR